MLYDAARHEHLERIEWDEAVARLTIERIVADAEERYAPGRAWPTHPLDDDGKDGAPLFNVYDGAAGVVWALHYLEAHGAVRLRQSYRAFLDRLPALNRGRLGSRAHVDAASFLMGDTGILLLRHWLMPSAEDADRLEAFIAANADHPARELMWGAPGTMLAALFLAQHTRTPRWADLYRTTARKLWSQLVWFDEFQCHGWIQERYGPDCACLGGVHGFVATAAPVIRGRQLLDAAQWERWQQCIVDTVQRTVLREGDQANWPPYLYPVSGRRKMLLQFCHGAPGFVICLGDLPTKALDALLVAAGEAIWAGGPLKKGAGLCHGTGGNGYAFLKLHARTDDRRWLDRARAFAMHGIVQAEAHARQYGQMRYTLWTGDVGFAVYLWDCIRGVGDFPTLDTFGLNLPSTTARR